MVSTKIQNNNSLSLSPDTIKHSWCTFGIHHIFRWITFLSPNSTSRVTRLHYVKSNLTIRRRTRTCDRFNSENCHPLLVVENEAVFRHCVAFFFLCTSKGVVQGRFCINFAVDFRKFKHRHWCNELANHSLKLLIRRKYHSLAVTFNSLQI